MSHPRSSPRFARLALTLTIVVLLGAPSLPSALASSGLTPGAPQRVTATAGAGGGQITLAWQAPGGLPGATGYRIYRGTVSGAEVFLADLGNVLTFTDSGLPRASTYYYRVSAFNVFG